MIGGIMTSLARTVVTEQMTAVLKTGTAMAATSAAMRMYRPVKFDFMTKFLRFCKFFTKTV
jgi:hypothetical protein